MFIVADLVSLIYICGQVKTAQRRHKLNRPEIVLCIQLVSEVWLVLLQSVDL